jgi:HEAT repeat protein
LADIQSFFQQTGSLHPKHGYIVKREIQRHTTVRTLILSLQQSADPRVSRILCELLGERHASSAISALLACLTHDDSDVRYEAADALAKIRKPATGPALFTRLKIEHEPHVQAMLIRALGAVGYRPAIPDLVTALSASEASVRASAAWSLGALKASEAYHALERVQANETDAYARQQIADALVACSISTSR